VTTGSVNRGTFLVGTSNSLREDPWQKMLISIFCIACVLRVLFIWLQGSLQLFDIQFIAADSRLYDGLARSLLAGQGFAMQGQPTAFVTPGSPLFLAALYALGITIPLPIGIVQSTLGGLTCLLVAIIGVYLGGR
jgi:hypothetical protein